MANGPEAFYLDKLRKLQGAPSITSPEANGGSLKVERLKTVPRGDTLPAYGSADPDPTYATAGARLTVLSITGGDDTDQEVYTCYEALGARAQQDQWNEQPTTYPYGSLLFPRTTRKYRFFFDQVPVFAIGQTTDTQNADATLINLQEADESAVVKTFTAFFDDVPTSSQQAALGNGGSGLGKTITFEEGDNAFPVVEWAFLILNSLYNPAANNEACPLPGYASLVLTDQKRTPSPDAALEAIETRTYQILPGKLITSYDSARLPRTLSAIPAYYLNGDKIQTDKQKVVYGTEPDTVTNVILSSKVDATTSLMAVKTNISRANIALPLVALPLMVDRADGADGNEYRTVVSVDATLNGDGTPNVAATAAALNAAVAAAVGLVQDTFHVIDYDTTPLSPTQVELKYTAVTDFPELFSSEYNSNIPERFRAPYNLSTDQVWLDTTGVQTMDDLDEMLLTGTANSRIVVSCKITPVTQYRAKRVTVFLPEMATLPLTLASTEQNGEGLGVKTVETVDSASQTITFTAFMLPGSGIVALQEGVTFTPLDAPAIGYTSSGSGLTLKTEKLVMSTGTTGNASYPVLSGQSYDEKLGIARPFTTQTEDAGTATELVGSANTQIVPKDALRSEVRVITPLDADLTAFYNAYYKTYGATIDAIEFPPVLTAINAEWETSLGKGDASEIGTTGLSGAGSLHLDLPESAQASATVIPNVAPVIQSVYARNVPATDVVFLMPDNTPTATILGRAAAQPWPVFQPVSHTLVCNGQKVSVRANANTRMSITLSASGNTTAISAGSGGDQDTSSVTRCVTFPPTIHGTISVGGTVDPPTDGGLPVEIPVGGYTNLPPNTGLISTTSNTSIQVTVTAKAHSEIDAVNAKADRTVTLTANGSISPSVLAATPGYSALPQSGVFAYRVISEPYSPGWSMVRVRTVNFADLRAATGGATALQANDAVFHDDGAAIGEPSTSPDTPTPIASLPTIDSTDPVLAPTPTFTPPSQVPGANTGDPTGAGNPGTTSSTLSITGQPVSLIVAAGASATFEVTVSGSNPTYQWYLGTPGSGVLLSGATGSSYIISSVSSDEGGSYYVVVSNSSGSVTSEAATLTVGNGAGGSTPSGDPYISRQPTAQVYMTGASGVYFTVIAGGTAPFTYQWYYQATAGATRTALANQKQATLTVSPIPGLAGASPLYSVDVTNVNGTVTSNAVGYTEATGLPTFFFLRPLAGYIGQVPNGLTSQILVELNAAYGTDLVFAVTTNGYGTLTRDPGGQTPADTITITAGSIGPTTNPYGGVVTYGNEVLYYQASQQDFNGSNPASRARGGLITLTATTTADGQTVSLTTKYYIINAIVPI